MNFNLNTIPLYKGHKLWNKYLLIFPYMLQVNIMFEVF